MGSTNLNNKTKYTQKFFLRVSGVNTIFTHRFELLIPSVYDMLKPKSIAYKTWNFTKMI